MSCQIYTLICQSSLFECHYLHSFYTSLLIYSSSLGIFSLPCHFQYILYIVGLFMNPLQPTVLIPIRYPYVCLSIYSCICVILKILSQCFAPSFSLPRIPASFFSQYPSSIFSSPLILSFTHSMSVYPCAREREREREGVRPSRCISKNILLIISI